MMQATKLQIAPRHLLILLLPVLVLTFSEYLLASFGDTTLSVAPLGEIRPAPIAELSARYTFLAAFLFYTAVAVTMTAVFGFELASRHTPRSILYALCGLLGVIAISLVFSTFEPAWMGSFESYELLGEDLFRAALGPGQLPACAPGAPMGCDGNGAFFAMRYLLDKVNLLASLSAGAVICGMVLALARQGPEDLTSHDGLLHEAEALKAAQDSSKRYLYCSGVLLTTGMALVLAWMKWPTEMIADEALRTEHGNLVDAISLYRGVSYSVLILSYYMPVSLLLMVRIERFREAVAQAGTPELAEDLKGFDINRIASLDAFKAIFAIISPILISAVGSLSGFELLG